MSIRMLNKYFSDREFKALLFDFDGTVADTMPAHLNAWNKALAVYNLSLSREQHNAMAGRPTQMIVEILNEMHGTHIDAEDFVKAKEIDYFASLATVRSIPSVVEIINFYKGKIPLAIVSGSRRSPVTRTLEALNMQNDFDLLVCAGDYKDGKPAPDCFLLAAEKLGVHPRDCLVFEDGVLGIESAKAAGMACLKIDDSHAISLAHT